LIRALLCLLLFVVASIATIAHFPATWAEHALRDRIDPLTLDDVHGNAWNGEARHSWWGETAMGRLSWQADPGPLLRGSVHARLHFELAKDQTLDARVLWKSDRLQVDALRAELVGSALQRFFQTINLQPIGDLQVQVEHAAFDRGVPVALRGFAIWRQATLLGPRMPVLLGDLRADFHVASSGVVIGKIRDLGGPVQVEGSLRLTLVGYRIDMLAEPRDPLLAESLSKLGEPAGTRGRHLHLAADWWWRKPDA